MSLPRPAQRISRRFSNHFRDACTAIGRAPGRVNLIGEHTDYNDGFVLPMALEHQTWVAVAPRSDREIHARADELDEEASWSIGDWHAQRLPDWTSYIAGVAELLHARDIPVPGCNLLVKSDVPTGGGLSSSAALEIATAHALLALADTNLPPTDIADIARAAEHEYAGVPCGIMDQYVSALAQSGHAFLLDCRTRTWEHIPLVLGPHVFVIINSGVRHKLASGEYAVRQQQCQTAVAALQKIDEDICALRDVTPDQLAAHAHRLDPTVAARARHVITENVRTQDAAAALRAGDLPAMGRLMSASHVSLRDDYAVSCTELDLLVNIVTNLDGIHGARMTGGGFGGCIVALARAEAVPRIKAAVAEQYDAAGHGPSQMLRSQGGAGAGVFGEFEGGTG